MRAAYALSINPDDPLAALEVGDLAVPPIDGWVTVRVVASALNHHDLWALRGVGLSIDRVPMVLGCDAAGIGPAGEEVIVHSVVSDMDDTRGFSLLSERYPGTHADWVAVPGENLLPKPAELSFVEAACLPTAWLTAYRMLTTVGRVKDGESVLVQGAGGGVATAAVVLATAMGKRVYATSRDPAKRERVAALGATALPPGAKLPERVDVVIETVGEATFEHSLKCAAPGARVVVAGATAGHRPLVDLRRVFAMQLEILGSSMGTRTEFAELLDLVAWRDIHPVIDSVYTFSRAREAFGRLASGNVFGKVVLEHS